LAVKLAVSSLTKHSKARPSQRLKAIEVFGPLKQLHREMIFRGGPARTIR
jgi:hypothetical protein